jgi:hypothetical protein
MNSNQGLCPIITLIARQVRKTSSFVACLQPSIKLSRNLSSSTISAFVNGSLGGESHPMSSSERQNERRACISLEPYQYRMQYSWKKQVTIDISQSTSQTSFYSRTILLALRRHPIRSEPILHVYSVFCLSILPT